MIAAALQYAARRILLGGSSSNRRMRNKVSNDTPKRYETTHNIKREVLDDPRLQFQEDIRVDLARHFDNLKRREHNKLWRKRYSIARKEYDKEILKKREAQKDKLDKLIDKIPSIPFLTSKTKRTLIQYKKDFDIITGKRKICEQREMTRAEIMRMTGGKGLSIKFANKGLLRSIICKKKRK